MKCSAPGSVLLLGEYSVLGSGGLGVALAVDQRVHVQVHNSLDGALRIEGSDGINQFSWPSGPGRLLDAVVEGCSEALEGIRELLRPVFEDWQGVRFIDSLSDEELREMLTRARDLSLNSLTAQD